MKEMLLRIAFVAAVAAVTYLAMTPTSLGRVIESGEQRHVLAFLVLPLLSGFAWPAVSLKRQFAWYALFGLAIEVVQDWMAVGRSGEAVDWLIDLAAAAVALWIVDLLRHDPAEMCAD